MSIGSLSLWWSGKVAENEAAAGVPWRCFSNQWFMEEAGRAVQNEDPHAATREEPALGAPSGRDAACWVSWRVQPTGVQTLGRTTR